MAKKIRKGKKKPVGGYRLIIFDFDGTLVDSVPGIHKNACDMAKKYGMKKISRKKIVKSVGAGLNKFLEWIFKPALKKMGLAKIRADYIRMYKKNFKYKAKVYPGARETLKKLRKKGIKLVIVSNKHRSFVIKTNKHLNLHKYFNLVIGRGDLKKDKPDAYPVNYVLKKYKIKKSQALLAGDSRYDMEAAKNAGIDGFYLTYGYGEGGPIKKFRPAYVSNKISDIAGLF